MAPSVGFRAGASAGVADWQRSVKAEGSGQADLIFIGRAQLIDPYWPKRAAKALRARSGWPTQYERGDIY